MKATTLILTTFIAMSGCGFEETQAPTPPIEVETDGGLLPGSDSQQQMQPPMPDPLPGSVCTDSVAVQGSATAGASVIVFGGSSSSIATDANPVTGRFCVDVPLVKGTANTLQIRAQDPVLGMSDPITRTVTQSGTCGDDVTNPPPDPVTSKNVALGSKGIASKTAESGNEGFLTDGDATTFAKYSGGNAWMAFDGWVYIKLDKVYSLEKIAIRWAGGTGDYGAQYKVLVSSMSDPGDPNLSNGFWTPVATVTAGDGGVDTFDLKSTKPIAQYVALWLEQDGNSWSWAEYFAIGEIEAWDVPQSSSTPTPTTQQNTCATMSSN